MQESRTRLIGRGIVIGLCALACVVALSLHAERVAAAGYTVSTTSDTGINSLRDAITQVNAGTGTGDTITISATGAITLTSALPALAKPVAITGPGAATLTVQAATTPNTATYRVFLVNSGVTASIANLTIANGNANAGGGIENDGTLTVANSILVGNSAIISGNSTTAIGGGIYNLGTLTVTNSTLSGNSAATEGGGITNFQGMVTVTNSTFSGNSASGRSGGGIDNVLGTLTMTNSTLSGNSALYGGGVYNDGTATVTNSTLSGNSATTSGASGGFGGGIENANGTLTLTNSTLSGNSASFDGGGIENFATLNLTNTIVAGNIAGGTGPDINGAVMTTDHNLIGSTSGTTGITNGVHGDIVNPTPRLDTLKDNGGTTPLPDGSHVKTFALLPGSPAIGAGDSSVCNSTTTPPGAAVGGKDQRGFPRPTMTCAIGAFEPQTITLSPITLPNGLLETSYSQAIMASGGTGPYTFAVTSGTLPPGLTLATNGTLSGEPMGTGSFTFTITATDHAGATGNRAYTLVVPAPKPLPSPRPGGGTGGGPPHALPSSRPGGSVGGSMPNPAPLPRS